MKKLFITTPIYYASGKPHIGHAYTTILADVIARYKKTLGYDVFFLTGMDEHGQKISDTAKNKGLEIQAMLNSVSKDFKQLWKDLDINYSNFIRTTDKIHCEAVQKTFSSLLQKQFIYEGEWKGLYCVNCEENYTKDQAIEKDGKLYCKVGHELSQKNEPSYFLKVSQYADWIKSQFKVKDFIKPEARVHELLGSFIDKGLEDLSVTRTSLTWGIPTKEDNKHVIYVWIDALLSYLSGLGYLSNDDKNFKKYFADKDSQVVHLMSKEITRFHCIYWPILLKMLDLRLPTHIISHGWVVTKEGKMSKSLGNIIDPYDYINTFGSDAFRYFIVRQVNLEKDGIFSHDLFVETFNSELANSYGNMATRTAGMIKKYFNNTIPHLYENHLDVNDRQLILNHDMIIKQFEENIENFKINNLLSMIQVEYKALNFYIENKKPWVLATDEKHRAELSNCLHLVFKHCCDLMILLSPILTKTTTKIEKLWNLKLSFKNLGKDWAGHKISDLAPIFARITNK